MVGKLHENKLLKNLKKKKEWYKKYLMQIIKLEKLIKNK